MILEFSAKKFLKNLKNISKIFSKKKYILKIFFQKILKKKNNNNNNNKIK